MPPKGQTMSDFEPIMRQVAQIVSPASPNAVAPQRAAEIVDGPVMKSVPRERSPHDVTPVTSIGRAQPVITNLADKLPEVARKKALHRFKAGL